MNQDLKNIKEKYGENMMHLCRKLFPSILEHSGLLFSLLKSNFAYSKILYDDIIKYELQYQFKNYINSLVNVETKKFITSKSPEELLDEAGYILYECHSEEEIQFFKKYYEYGEELCTFDGGRLDSDYVFFAVKKDVNSIKRESFTNPTRQDPYGVSVISIQFTRGKVNTLSIKNRYNEIVDNPDATFSNNLENIIPGLTFSFEKKYNLQINANDKEDLEIPGYVKTDDGKLYKYNYEINNIYYCPNNIIVDDGIENDEIKTISLEKEKYIILDYFILDLVNKEIKIYDDDISDDFINGLNDIKNINIIKDKKTGFRTIFITPNEGEKISIGINNVNKIYSYKNPNLTKCGCWFLSYNDSLEKIDLPNLEKYEDGFLYNNDISRLLVRKSKEGRKL